MPAAAAIKLGLALLPMVETGVEHFVAWINSLRASLKQSGEWTDQQEADYRAALLSANIAPEEQPDA